MEKWKKEMLEKIFPTDTQYQDIEKGLEIKYLNIPRKLYKYCSFSDYNKKNLNDCVVYLSFPEKFNDPYDCALTYSNINLLNYYFPKYMENIFKEINFKDEELSIAEKNEVVNSKDSIRTFTEIMIKKEETIKLEDRNEVLENIYYCIKTVASKLEPSFKEIIVLKIKHMKSQNNHK